MPVLRHALLCLAFVVTTAGDLCAQMSYEGVKFWVYRTDRPDATKLWRVRLTDGSHFYTIEKEEADRQVAKKQGVIEPMDAYVMPEAGDGLVQLRCFTETTSAGVVRYFYTAFAAEASIVGAKAGTREIKANAYVFPHDHKPSKEQASELLPVHVFFSATSGEHFYTTSDKEKDDLIRRAKSGRLQPEAKKQAKASEKEIVEASVQLATIALGRPVKVDAELVKQFDEVIRSIRRSYAAMPPQTIAATLFACHKVLNDKGKPLPLERIAKLVATAIPRNQTAKSRIAFSEVAATVTVCYVGGDYEKNPEQAAVDARAAMEEILIGAAAEGK